MSANGRGFGDVLMELLRRREQKGRTFEAADVALLRELVELARSADVKAATEVDPVWRYRYNAAGDVVEEHATVAPFPAGAPRFAGNVQSFCYAYDPLRRMTGIKWLSRTVPLATQPGEPPRPAPCDDTANLTAVAAFSYDAQNRRVRARVLGEETYYVYGQGGELLAEVDGAGTSVREHVWLEGQALAQVLPVNIALRRPAPAGSHPRAGT